MIYLPPIARLDRGSFARKIAWSEDVLQFNVVRDAKINDGHWIVYY